MPNYFQPQNPWLGAAQAGNSLASSIDATMLQIPRARAEGRNMQQEFLMNQLKMQQEQQMMPYQTDLLKAQTGAQTAMGKSRLAEAGMYDSEAALNRAKQGQLTQQDQLHVKLGQDMGNFVKESLTMGQVTPETAQTLAQSLATLDKLDPKLMPSIMQEIGISSSGMGTNASLGASAATGYKVPMRSNVPAGSTSVNTMNPQDNPFVSPVTKPNEGPIHDKVSLIHTILSGNASQDSEHQVSPMQAASMADEILSGKGFGTMGGETNQPAQTNAPAVGTIYKGYKFLGGDPANQASWEKAQ